MNYNQIIFTISILIILSFLLLIDSHDMISFRSGNLGEKQNRKIKGENLFLNFLLTIFTITYFGLSFYYYYKFRN